MRVGMVSTALRRNKVRTSRRERALGRIAVLMALALAAACRPDPTSAQAAAERFIDAHYVAIDLATSQALTTGLAHAKVLQERALVGSQTIDETTRKPQVWYRLLQERPLDDGAVQFLYEATLSPEGAERFQRRLLITVRRDAAGWMVSNYEELPD